eukprot:g14921.t1
MAEPRSAASTSGADAELPPPKILLRRPGTLELFRGPSKDHGAEKDKPGDLTIEPGFPELDTSSTEWSRDGRFLAAVCSTGVEVVDMTNRTVVGHVDAPGARAVHFSPLGTYLLTWQPPSKSVDGERPPGNLVVWSTASWSEALRVSQKQLRRSAWPSLQWSSDELIAARGLDNDIQIYHGKHLDQGIVARVPCPKLGSFSLAPGTAPYRLATFVPEMKGKPGKIALWSYPVADTPVASRSSFRAQEATFKWSPDGRAVLCLTSTDVDATGKSYYGSTGLYLMHADGQFDCAIAPAKEGTVQDVQWGPGGSNKGNKFVVIAGSMPSTSTLYNIKGEPMFEFGSAHRNTISWSPHGRFLLLAGLGNLAGEMDFWDVNRKKVMGSTSSHCAVAYGWSPDSRWFLTATCAPRMNVDNDVKVFRYDGSGPVVKKEIDVLWDAVWQPAAQGVYPDRPASPGRKGPTAADAAAGKGRTFGEKAAVYRSPGSTGSLAALMRAERGVDKAGAGGKKVGRVDAARATGAYIPGMAPPEANKPSKNAKKQEAKKRAKERAEAQKQVEAILAAATGGDEGKEGKEEEKAPAPVDPAKRAKALSKKIKKLETVKAKKDAGEAINADQTALLESEASLRQELASLQL